MNASPTAALWLHSLGGLALQVLLVLSVAGVVQSRIASARGRRSLWRAALLLGAALSINAGTGLDRNLADWLATPSEPAARFLVRSDLPVEARDTPLTVSETALHPVSEAGASAAQTEGSASIVVRWPAWVWLAGMSAVGVWALMPRCWLLLARGRVRDETPKGAARRVAALAGRLGLRGRVGVVTLPCLQGPIAFGIWRPTVAVPVDFWAAHTEVEQDAMLAHELAHLAARDPLWLAMADALVALLWWHPAVWWARRQLRAAGESAADEASLVVKDGPTVLAGCLVALASRWRRRGVLGLLGVDGFRSGLGRRVERLLRLEGGLQEADPGPGLRLRWGFAGASVLALAWALPGWFLPLRADFGVPLFVAVGEAIAGPVAFATQANAATVGLDSPPNPVPAASGAGEESRTGGTVDSNATAYAMIAEVSEVPGLERPLARRLAMDAVTRRLGKLGWFQGIRCDPEGQDRIRIGLVPRQADADGAFWTPERSRLVRELVERLGRLEFHAVHPDSSRLVRAGSIPEGYESRTLGLVGRGADPLPDQQFLLERTPVPGLGSSNLVEVVAKPHWDSGEPTIEFVFDPVGRTNFAELTRQSVGRQIAVVLDGELVMAPRVHGTIPGGNGVITGRFTEAEAQVLAASLAHPLRGSLRVLVPVPAPSRVDLGPREPAPQQPRPEVQSTGESISPSASGTAEAEAEAAGTSAEAPQLMTRTYRTQPPALRLGMEAVTGVDVTSHSFAEVLRSLFIAAGVQLSPANESNAPSAATGAASFHGPDGRAVFHNERNGLLLARLPGAEQEIVEQVLNTLTAAPPLVEIEAKFVEIPEGEIEALGLDGAVAAPRRSAETNALAEPPVPSVGNGSREAGAPSAIAVTHVMQELRGDQLEWAARLATNAGHLRGGAATVGKLAGVLTEAQYQVVLRALDQRSSVKVLAAPKVTTLTGRQAQIQVSDLQTVVTGINPAARQPAKAAAATNPPVYTTIQIPTGPVLHVIPSVSADGGTIQLTVLPSVTEFLGYDQPPADAKVRVWESGESRLVDLPLPRFRVQQMQTTTSVPDGQTLVLGGMPVEDRVRTTDKVPMLEDLPRIGRLFRREGTGAVRKQLLVFVTATVIDPAGNPVRAR